ncbi:MAG: 4Fe-4S binding protein [Epsilonproteobacteria bacterium]|nr:4Fe-4S binding protein [Campylobacterota bacterium]
MSALQKHQQSKAIKGITLTLALLLLPIIQYNGLHLLHFNFYHSRFELFFVGFEATTTTLLVLFVLSALFVILAANLTLSRLFCGRLCPKTLLKSLYTDFIKIKLLGIATKRTIGSEKRADKHPIKSIVAVILLLVINLIGTLPIFLYLLPLEIFIKELPLLFVDMPLVLALWLSSALYLFAETLFFKEFFCSYICPYELFNTLFYNKESAAFRFRGSKSCIGCEACVQVCPVPNLDIKKGFDHRCIACGECAAVCADVMRQHGAQESLITYSDEDHNRPKSAFYSMASRGKSVLLLLFLILFTGALFDYLLCEERLKSCSLHNERLYEK